MNVGTAVEINSPKQQVWAAIIDIRHCAAIISAIIDIRILHQPAQGIVGLKWAETRKIFGKEATETMWITHSKDEEYYVTRAENHGMIYITKMALTESNGKTHLTLSFTAQAASLAGKIMSSVMGVFTKPAMVKMLQQDLADIKKYVENANK